MYQLHRTERDEVVAVCDHLERLKYSATLPYAFTEHGALMVASVLNTDRAVDVSLYVVRAFIGLRDAPTAHKELSRHLRDLEARVERKLSSHDQAIAGILTAIRELMTPPEPRRRPIGFVHEKDGNERGKTSSLRASSRKHK